MKVVELTDINKVLDENIERLRNDPMAKQSQYAHEVAEWGIELLNTIKEDMLLYSGDVKVVSRRKV